MRVATLCLVVVSGCSAGTATPRATTTTADVHASGSDDAEHADSRRASPEVPRAEIITRSPSTASRGGTLVGSDGESVYEALGMPAVSEDGTRLVYVESEGDGANDAYALVFASAETAAVERRDPLSESHASEEGTDHELTRQREARARITAAQTYLAEHVFRTIPRIADTSELTVEDADGVVEIRDASGRSRFRRRLVAAPPAPPTDLDDDELEAWEIEHPCDDALQDLEAWRIDATRVLLVLHVGATPDDCWVRRESVVATLSP
ncbi:MAG: hypothetical protein J0L92_13365 [Deltaproteobacteria bacterium]|nr:hypothetical protein [Deltaproteobacteria bacterium]